MEVRYEPIHRNPTERGIGVFAIGITSVSSGEDQFPDEVNRYMAFECFLICADTQCKMGDENSLQPDTDILIS